MQKKKYYLNIIFMAVLLGLVFYVILKDEDLSEILNALKDASIPLMLLAAMAAIIYVVMEGVSIQIILLSLGLRTNIIKCVKYSFIGFFFNAITPSATGGQPMQVLYMRSDGINIGASSVTLLFWTIIYKIALVVIESFVFIFMHGFARTSLRGYMWLFVTGIIVNVVSIFLYSVVVFSENGAKNIAYFATWFLHKLKIVKRREKIEKKLDNLLMSYKEGAEYMRSHIKTAVVVLGTTIIQRVSYFAVTWFVYMALGLDGYTCIQIIVLQSFVSVCIDILPFPGGVGVNEGFFVKLFAPVMGKSMAVSAMLLSRGASFYVILIASAVITVAAQIHQIHMEGRKIKLRKDRNQDSNERL
ncbi:MAG TPA: hypothetical protein DCZ23_05745 [Lachnospiraceae bacterium]|nr:hypothetical protein [Lachnospiraceae bacterium]